MNNILTMKVARPGGTIRATDRVFLIRTPGQQPTYFAVHDTARFTRSSFTMLVAFARELDARIWARSLDVHKQERGAYPQRDVARQTRRLSWVDDDACPDAPTLDVVDMPFADVVGMLKGTGINCRLLYDGSNMVHRTDVMQPFDRAAACTRLEHSLTMACDEK